MEQNSFNQQPQPSIIKKTSYKIPFIVSSITAIIALSGLTYQLFFNNQPVKKQPEKIQTENQNTKDQDQKPQTDNQTKDIKSKIFDLDLINATLTLPEEFDIVWYGKEHRKDGYNFLFSFVKSGQPIPDFLKPGSSTTLISASVVNSITCKELEDLIKNNIPSVGKIQLKNNNYCLILNAGIPGNIPQKDFSLYGEYTEAATKIFTKNITKK